MKYKCKCHEDSPFHWKHNPRPSMFAKDPLFTVGAKLSQNQTLVIERERERGRDISHFPGMSEKSAQLLSNRILREFNIFSRARANETPKKDPTSTPKPQRTVAVHSRGRQDSRKDAP